MISFFRELPFQIQIQGKFSILRFAAGFSKRVDPLSGMTVNLKHVNSWLGALSLNCFQQNFLSPFDLLQVASDFLEPLAKSQGASITRVQIQFEDQDLLSKNCHGVTEYQRSWWVTDQSQKKRVQVTAHFLLKNWNDVERVQAILVAESYRASVQELFPKFPFQPVLIEVKDPLKGSSTQILL